MRPRVLAVLALAALLLVVPTAAQAKGAAEATIDGGGPGARLSRSERNGIQASLAWARRILVDLGR
jgi:hypothetical protein